MRLKTLMSTCLPALALGIVGCDVDVEDTGKLPEVEVKEGELPDVDVTTPDVEVGTEEKQVTVPDIDVDTEETTVTVPDVDVDIPKEDDQ